MLIVRQTQAYAAGTCRYFKDPVQILYRPAIAVIILISLQLFERGEMFGKVTGMPGRSRYPMVQAKRSGG